MFICETVKSLLKESSNFVQWLLFNLNSSVEIGLWSKVRGAKIEKNVRVGSHCDIQGGELNSFSYMGNYCELPQVKIGKFCSIANHVILAAGNHPVDYVSTSPYTYSLTKNSLSKKQLYDDEFFYYDNNKHLCKIGNDVWIGTDALLVCSNKALIIGDGAVIGAGAVVIKDVPPYAIVAGCPAKIIRYRFTDEIIQHLQELEWWNKDTEWIQNHVDEFSSVDTFLKQKRGV